MAREACGTVAAGAGGHEIGAGRPGRDVRHPTGTARRSRKLSVCTHPPMAARRTTCTTVAAPGLPEGGAHMGEPGLRLVPAGGSRADVDVLMGRVARGDASAFEALYDELSA